MASRNVQLAMDHASGMTFVALSLKYDVHPSRCHQIFRKVAETYGLRHQDNITCADLASAIKDHHHRNNFCDFKHCEDPESFYHMVTREREADESSMWVRIRQKTIRF